ncbi:cystathionine gamma-synthase [Massariosphaeria phaeospora]|uniref:cystathionine gamma-synthase n=1 Tax=Massariosphaeria phaeospora TaxID=100035 RepID=A0A7C8I2H3_9PLEO|nr:cystathionine gamma-synthase [Massariosphaeria phaeospora]
MMDAIPPESDDVGETIPPMTAHAVSVSLPTWKANVAYEEGEEWVLSRMKTGYPRSVLLAFGIYSAKSPRFFIHKEIEAFAIAIAEKYGKLGERAMLFPSHVIASRCVEFFFHQVPELVQQHIRILDLVPATEKARSEELALLSPKVSAVLYPGTEFKTAKAFWQHSGDGISSRRAEYCYHLFKKGDLVESSTPGEGSRFCKGPRRYQRKTSIDSSGPRDGSTKVTEGHDPTQFVEERFGRNLDLSMTVNAKLAVRRRIAGSLTADVGLPEALALHKDERSLRSVAGFSEDDVYLYPCGMSAIFNSHRNLMAIRGPLKSIVYGFPYIDTLKIVEKFGPGCLFYGFGSSEELDDLEKRLIGGERFLALFTEFPGNPQLRSPDLERIRKLADQYDFCVVIDETVGNFLNVHVLPYGDVVVSSLTKIFSGDSNVMGGSLVLNPKGKWYTQLKQRWDYDYEDNHWAEDSIVLERNSRDFVSRIERINSNAEAICDVLRADSRVKQVYYPKHSPTRPFYDKCRTPTGGYGGLLSATFHSKQDAAAFFDNLDSAKGPSLGTNFTLSSPYVILAHYWELDWCESWGVEPDLIRFSVGLEETSKLVKTFRDALDCIPNSG